MLHFITTDARGLSRYCTRTLFYVLPDLFFKTHKAYPHSHSHLSLFHFSNRHSVIYLFSTHPFIHFSYNPFSNHFHSFRLIQNFVPLIFVFFSINPFFISQSLQSFKLIFQLFSRMFHKNIQQPLKKSK